MSEPWTPNNKRFRSNKMRINRTLAAIWVTSVESRKKNNDKRNQSQSTTELCQSHLLENGIEDNVTNIASEQSPSLVCDKAMHQPCLWHIPLPHYIIHFTLNPTLNTESCITLFRFESLLSIPKHSLRLANKPFHLPAPTVWSNLPRNSCYIKF